MTQTTTATMLPADIIELLLEMGLTRTEVQVYQYLLTFKSAIPSAIARDTGQARGRIYEGMRALVEKGFAREEPTRPIQFFPTPLPDILNAVQARLTQQLAAVRRGQTMAANTANIDVPPPLRPMRMRDVRVLSGRRSCFAEMGRMLETARRSFWLMGGGRFAERLVNAPLLIDNLRNAAARGIDVQLLISKTATLPPALADFGPSPGRPVLHEAHADALGPIVTCTTESTSLEVLTQPDDALANRGDDIAIQVTNEVFALAVHRRFDVARSFLQGSSPPPVFQWLGPQSDGDAFVQAVRHARQDVRVLGPREWTNYLGVGWERASSVYEGARARGVRLRAVALREGEADQDLGRFSPSWEFRQGSPMPLWVTIVDGRELFQAFTHGSLPGPPQFRRSTHEGEIRFYADLFEKVWESARPVEPVHRIHHLETLEPGGPPAVTD